MKIFYVEISRQTRKQTSEHRRVASAPHGPVFLVRCGGRGLHPLWRHFCQRQLVNSLVVLERRDVHWTHDAFWQRSRREFLAPCQRLRLVTEENMRICIVHIVRKEWSVFTCFVKKRADCNYHFISEEQALKRPHTVSLSVRTTAHTHT